MLQLVAADLERCVGAVEEDFHDGGVAARMHGGHFHVAVVPGEIFESDGFVFVVADDVFHHEVWGERLRGGEVAGEVEAGGAVEVGVCDVEVVCAGWPSFTTLATASSIVINKTGDILSSTRPPNRLPDNSLLVIIIILHIRNLLFFLLSLPQVP